MGGTTVTIALARALYMSLPSGGTSHSENPGSAISLAPVLDILKGHVGGLLSSEMDRRRKMKLMMTRREKKCTGVLLVHVCSCSCMHVVADRAVTDASVDWMLRRKTTLTLTIFTLHVRVYTCVCMHRYRLNLSRYMLRKLGSNVWLLTRSEAIAKK